MNTSLTIESSPQFKARAAGGFYLLNTVTILLAVFFFRGIIVAADPSATASNLRGHEIAFRLGFAFELISTASSMVVAALFYELLKPVNSSVSLIAAFFRLVACATAVVGYLFQFAPLQILGATNQLSRLTPEQVQAIALLIYRLHGSASDMVIIFFGFHFVMIGYLIFRSTFLPRALGVLVGLAGFGGLISLAPPVARYLFVYFVAIGLLAELSLAMWLLFKAVNVQRWNERASLNGLT